MTMQEACQLVQKAHVHISMTNDYDASRKFRIRVSGITAAGDYITQYKVYSVDEMFLLGFESILDCDIRSMINEVSKSIERKNELNEI